VGRVLLVMSTAAARKIDLEFFFYLPQYQNLN
jgi:hypothetical protein